MCRPLWLLLHDRLTLFFVELDCGERTGSLGEARKTESTHQRLMRWDRVYQMRSEQSQLGSEVEAVVEKAEYLYEEGLTVQARAPSSL